MSRRFFSAWLGFLVLIVSGRADILDAVCRARELLGPDGWSEIVRIEKVRPGFSRPVVVYALVFELADRLWYYEENTGTQSLSLYRGRLAEDKADIGPLLREIDPGFGRYEVVDPEPSLARAAGKAPELPQGCFIDCVAELQSMIAAGAPLDGAWLVAYYAETAGDGCGHTVLLFTRGGRRYCYDPTTWSKSKPVPSYVSREALAIAWWAAPVGHLPPQRAVFLTLRTPGAGESKTIPWILVAGGALPAKRPVQGSGTQRGG